MTGSRSTRIEAMMISRTAFASQLSAAAAARIAYVYYYFTAGAETD